MEENEKRKIALTLAVTYLILMTSMLYSERIVGNTSEEPPRIETTIEVPPTFKVTKTYIPLSQEEIEKEISELEITDNNKKPYDVYKIIRYKDSNNYYKTTIVNTHISFVVGKDGIKRTFYTIVDDSSKEPLFSTTDFKTITSINKNFNNAVLISYGNLSDLNSIAEFNNCPFRLPENIEEMSLTSEEVARYYIQIVPKSNRTTYNYFISPKIKTLT